MTSSTATSRDEHAIPWTGIAAACAAVLVGIGIARFAYTPLIPAVVDAGWFAPTAAFYLGAANLLGYLLGAILGNRLAARLGTTTTLRLMMLAAGVSMVACAEPLGFVWMFAWRLLAGIAGGSLMVLAAPTVLAAVPEARRGLAGGLIFTGVGLGIAISGTLVPALLAWGLVEAWLVLGGLCLALTAGVWFWWPKSDGRPAVAAAVDAPTIGTPSVFALLVVYALVAAGLVPHMVFLVDFIVRGLGQPFAAGAFVWVVFGVGAVVGPTAARWLADRVGFAAALRLTLVLQAIAVLVLASVESQAVILLSALLVGAYVPGVVPLVLGRVHDLIADPMMRRRAWGRATMAFALGQAAGAYGLSALFDSQGTYGLLFVLAAGGIATALVIDLVWIRRPAA